MFDSYYISTVRGFVHASTRFTAVVALLAVRFKPYFFILSLCVKFDDLDREDILLLPLPVLRSGNTLLGVTPTTMVVVV